MKTEFRGNDGLNSLKIKNAIDNFTNYSVNAFQGEIWDKVRAKYDKYDECLSEHARISEIMTTTIKSILSELQQAMNGYDSIDLTQLEDLKQKRTICENKILEIQNMMNESNDNNSSLFDSLNCQKNTLDELNKLISITENVQNICKQSEQKMSSLLEEMTRLSSKTEEITPSKKVSFQI